MFDNRVAELSNNKAAMMGPTWDCKTPTGISDYDLRPEMKTIPSAGSRPTEALSAVVRSQLMDFIRHSQFHLEFTRVVGNNDRSSASLSKAVDLETFEKGLEDQFFKLCSDDNPLQVMAINMIRGYLAKCHLLQQRSKEVKATVKQAEPKRNLVITYAMKMLECDTKLMTLPLTRGYTWPAQDYFPFR
ncbi:hypothetical protein CLAFUW4_05673 [Fulvia fulva]|uniref:Uncharacterized protein n=1 Tax=Passalora fulva TaxID=5499 RepID=A0A9Q8LIZ7_PASFU|nr:uncharacterized protein CLAFUR5_05814 [Fulvia fulva]KAK4624460.1 hypothetical protein CLAFUR4_05667 [Fulvia fulva]KAK4625164.1 hypothetical protein CLAFUR0_05675 [Fulvia fulva]UJO18009.1 hypothetical protein CLAFUR5_05814 [Fulvia fulva]WPV14790.1 hypothetical protein CLAFUW4_05673 [Fulvia fulva]WPV29909.1 hypothetical protein CLAFUW7_05672 [Fulvia fulva]